MFKEASVMYKAFRFSARHEPHLWPLMGFIFGAPLLSAGIITWNCSKDDVGMLSFVPKVGMLAYQLTDTSKPSQVLFTHSSHKKAYVPDPVVENLRKEIYSFDAFEHTKKH